jgi:Rps23 Pro-64 3,4-dihydroxylase Tpa1-like proline 4-hydroxylase
MQRADISRLIVERIGAEAAKLRGQFQQPGLAAARYVVIDNVLPETLARQVFTAFPSVTQMRLLSSFRERKYTSKALGEMDPLIAATIFAFQTDEMIRLVEFITSFPDMVGDPLLYAGGISTMLEGHYLSPHIDNSHDSAQQLYRRLNLLYYVTPDWRAENGGSLELWDKQVNQRVEIPSHFNRLVIMETHCFSWHSVNPVKVVGQRCCVSNYYFSPHPPGGIEHFHITCFMGRPEQRVRRALIKVDSTLRSLVRKAVKQGIGRSDLYSGKV